MNDIETKNGVNPILKNKLKNEGVLQSLEFEHSIDNVIKESVEKFKISEEIEKSAFFWEIWILKLEQYLDKKYASDIDRYSLYSGFVFSALLVTSMLILGFTYKKCVLILFSLSILGYLYLNVNKIIWDNNYHEISFDVKCFPDFGEQNWIKKRLEVIYKFILHRVIGGIIFGIFFTTLILFFVNLWL